MPRAPREFVSGEAYHLTARGVDRRDVFLDDEDRRRFVCRLGAVVDERAVSCLAYCLMGNHVHLVVTGPAAGMSAVMREVLGGHARFFNKKYERSGHLFGERFHDVRLASTAQVHAAIRYVALNPVRAGIVDRPDQWPWSSFAAVRSGGAGAATIDMSRLGQLLDAAHQDVLAALCQTVEVGLADARIAAAARA